MKTRYQVGFSALEFYDALFYTLTYGSLILKPQSSPDIHCHIILQGLSLGNSIGENKLLGNFGIFTNWRLNPNNSNLNSDPRHCLIETSRNIMWKPQTTIGALS